MANEIKNIEAEVKTSNMVQYGVWANCVSECKFCLRTERTYYTKEEQLRALQSIRTNLDYIDWKNKFSAGISLLGGELYYITDPDLQNAFLDLIDDIIEKVLLVSPNPDVKLSTVTNGMYEPNFLYRVVDRVIEKTDIEKLDINFSYDLKYRYSTEERRLQALDNINAFNKRYNYKVNVQMILTQYLIDMWKEGKFKYNEFVNTNFPGNHLTFLYPHPIHTGQHLPDFFFKRSDFISFIEYLKNENLGAYLSFIFSCWNSASFKYTGLRDKDKSTKVARDIKAQPVLSDGKEEINEKCGHSVLYQCYADSDKCMLCDLIDIDNEGYLSQGE